MTAQQGHRLEGVLRTVQQLESGRAEVENAYARAVRPEGNPRSRRLIDEVFEVCDRKWRGVGLIPRSGFRLRDAFREHDAEDRFAVSSIEAHESTVCLSGEILRGRKKPHDCPAFGRECTPQTPLGATMVSSEGACAAYYAYGRHLDANRVLPVTGGVDTVAIGHALGPRPEAARAHPFPYT